MISKQYLEKTNLFQRNSDEFLRRFITVNETWIHYFTRDERIKQTINGDYYAALLDHFNNISKKKHTNSATNCFPIQHIRLHDRLLKDIKLFMWSCVCRDKFGYEKVPASSASRIKLINVNLQDKEKNIEDVTELNDTEISTMDNVNKNVEDECPACRNGDQSNGAYVCYIYLTDVLNSDDLTIEILNADYEAIDSLRNLDITHTTESIYAHVKKFEYFVSFLRQNCIINKSDTANTLYKIYDKELTAYVLDNIVYAALHEK
ncbi:hypothetical protein ALC53_01142 [Atta colombica]|uniref:Uncharacterized protein n=1 Tax=Atta colombica TaxID=520822 RepID=A0A151I6M6_9HYME|nr:hypothetical protein ALC53_01142 [Atta colombica]